MAQKDPWFAARQTLWRALKQGRGAYILASVPCVTAEIDGELVAPGDNPDLLKATSELLDKKVGVILLSSQTLDETSFPPGVSVAARDRSNFPSGKKGKSYDRAREIFELVRTSASPTVVAFYCGFRDLSLAQIADTLDGYRVLVRVGKSRISPKDARSDYQLNSAAEVITEMAVMAQGVTRGLRMYGPD